jgi:hypothetical protein
LARPAGPPVPARAHARAKNARAKSRSTLPTRPTSALVWRGGRRRSRYSDSVRPESKLSNCWECCLVFSCTNLHRILQRKYI